MSDKPFPALCADCKHSEVSKDSSWTHQCQHPKVVAADPYALATNFEGRTYGSACRDERKLRSWFAPCGMKGKLWEKRDD